jgi:hypothetical protein
VALDNARRIEANLAKLPELLAHPAFVVIVSDFEQARREQ